jgi:hypothetical protein
MNEKEIKHNEKMRNLKKHFKKLKLIAVVLWLAANIIIDTVVILLFSIEIVVFAIIISFILSTMFMIKYLNNIDKIRIAQETQLMEETPLGRLKI